MNMTEMPTFQALSGSTGQHSVAVILGAGRNGLGAVRSLYKKRIGTIVVCSSRFDPAYLSRLPLRKVLFPRGEALDQWLSGFIKSITEEADCVIPTSDEFASALRRLSNPGEQQLPWIHPPENLVDVLNDKRSEIRLIESMGIPLPATVMGLERLARETSCLRFPIIIKPRTYQGYAVLGAKNRIINSQAELAAFNREFTECLDVFLAQEVIPGDESHQWVCNATFDRGSDLVSAFTFQRLGTVPYLYGVTTFAISKHNPEVKALCAQIGRALNYTGPAMFEFKVDPRSGQFCYIEINPRLGMCNWFDTQCGVNNVYNTYALSVGIQPQSNVDGQLNGKTYLNAPMDLYARLRARQNLWPVMKLYAKHMPRWIVPSTWYWRDPMPILSDLLRSVIRFWRALRGT